MGDKSIGGLYKQSGSPYWWASVSINGQRRRLSTKTTDRRLAEEFLAKYTNRLVVQRLDSELELDWVNKVRWAWDDEKSWLHQMHKEASRRARKSGRSFTLTLSELTDIALESGGRCAVTGIPFSDTKPDGSKTAPYRQSLDRIDSSRGYEPDNCRLVCFVVNVAMLNWGESVMQRIAKAVVYRELEKELTA